MQQKPKQLPIALEVHLLPGMYSSNKLTVTTTDGCFPSCSVSIFSSCLFHFCSSSPYCLQRGHLWQRSKRCEFMHVFTSLRYLWADQRRNQPPPWAAAYYLLSIWTRDGKIPAVITTWLNVDSVLPEEQSLTVCLCPREIPDSLSSTFLNITEGQSSCQQEVETSGQLLICTQFHSPELWDVRKDGFSSGKENKIPL